MGRNQADTDSEASFLLTGIHNAEERFHERYQERKVTMNLTSLHMSARDAY